MVQDDLDIDQLYAWIDTIPLSRAKKNIARDFSDGVLTAELTAYHLPKLVDLHNYPPSSSKQQKTDNWQTLNKKVFSKIGFKVPDSVIQELVESKQGVIEMILAELKTKFEKTRPSTAPEASKIASPPRTTTPPGDLLNADEVIKALNIEKLEADTSSYTRMLDKPDTSKNDNNNNTDRQVTKVESEAATSELRSVAKRQTPSATVGYVVRPQTAAADINGNLGLLGIPGGPRTDQAAPAQLVYRGHKMVPLQMLENKEKELKNLEFVNATCSSKILRLEVMIKVKDQRIEDLTHQLQNLRSMHDRLTDEALVGVKK